MFLSWNKIFSSVTKEVILSKFIFSQMTDFYENFYKVYGKTFFSRDFRPFFSPKLRQSSRKLLETSLETDRIKNSLKKRFGCESLSTNICFHLLIISIFLIYQTLKLFEGYVIVLWTKMKAKLTKKKEAKANKEHMSKTKRYQSCNSLNSNDVIGLFTTLITFPL